MIRQSQNIPFYKQCGERCLDVHPFDLYDNHFAIDNQQYSIFYDQYNNVIRSYIKLSMLGVYVAT